MNANRLSSALLFAAILFGCGQALAGPLDNWHWRNPLPNGNYVADTYVINGIVFTNGTFFGAAAFGVVATSADGIHWVTNSTPTTNDLNDIIFANGGFMAVGNNGTVETSANGTNWVLQNSGTSANLYSVAYGNGKYAAVGGPVIASSDGVHWSPAISVLSGAGQIAGGPAGFIAVNGSDQDYFSADGLNWTTNTLTVPVTGFNNDTLQAQIVTYFNGDFLIGSYIRATSLSADMFIFSSSDGVHWTTNALGNTTTDYTIFSYSYFMTGNAQAIAGGTVLDSDFLQFSSNGVTWSQTNILNISVPSLYASAGAYGSGTYVITGSGGVIVSQDGLNWTNEGNLVSPPPVGPTSTIYSIAYSNGTYVAASSSSFVASTNDSTYAVESNTPSLVSVVSSGLGFVAVGSNGQLYQSGDGFTWMQHSSGTTSNLRSITVGGNPLGIGGTSHLFVTVGDNGAVQTSASGLAWTSRSSGTSLGLYGITYSNGQYVAVGQQGTVVTSPDGENWTVQYSGTLSNLTAVTYGSDGFLAVGTGGTMLTSPDGATWTPQNAETSRLLTSATFGNGYYLVTGSNNVVLTSPDGVNWTSRNVGAMGGQTLYGSGFLNGCFDVVGSGGTILESDSVPPLFDLSMHSTPPNNVFTAFATPGSNFRIVWSTNLASGSWSTLASFSNAAAITVWTNSAAAPAGGHCFYRLVSP